MEDRERELFSEEEINVEELIEVIRRNFRLIVYITFGFLLLGVLYILFKTPMYKAEATILIEPEDTSKVLFQDMTVSSYIMRKEYMETQKEIIKSRRVLRNMVEKLKLYDNLIYKKEGKSREEIVKSLVAYFTDTVNVSFLKDTRLVKVSALSPDKKLSARIANTICEEYRNFMIEQKFASTKDTVKYLENQIKRVKEDLAKKEQALQFYSAQKQIYYVSDKESTILQQFQDINNALVEARIARIKAESSYNQYKNMKFSEYPEVVNNPIVQGLIQDYSKLESDYNNKKQFYKPDYPEMKRLKAQLDSLKKRLDKEIRNIATKKLNELRAEYESAKKKEEGLLNEIKTYQDELISFNKKSINFNALKIEVENMKNLLEYITKKYNETMVSARLAGLSTSNIRIVDRAEIPKFPSSPKKKLILIISIFLGGFIGVFYAFASEYFNKSVSTNEEVTKIVGKPILAVIPDVSLLNDMNSYKYKYKYGYGNEISELTEKILEKPELLLYYAPEHVIAENYRTLRTSILFSKGGGAPKVISITSSLPKEGKTTTTVNLAISFTQLGEKVIIVDSDMRKPKIHRIFEIKNRGGLSEYLVGDIDLEKAVKKTEVENLYIINSGVIPPNPAELINSEKFPELLEILKSQYDRVIIDSPPVIPVIDPVIIGNVTDGVILTVWGGHTWRDDLKNAVEKLNTANVFLIGVVVNKVSYDYHKGYYKRYKSGYKYKYTYKSKHA